MDNMHSRRRHRSVIAVLDFHRDLKQTFIHRNLFLKFPRLTRPWQTSQSGCGKSTAPLLAGVPANSCAIRPHLRGACDAHLRRCQHARGLAVSVSLLTQENFLSLSRGFAFSQQVPPPSSAPSNACQPRSESPSISSSTGRDTFPSHPLRITLAHIYTQHPDLVPYTY